MAFWTTAGIFTCCGKGSASFWVLSFFISIVKQETGLLHLADRGNGLTPEERSTASGIFIRGRRRGNNSTAFNCVSGTTIGWQFTFVVIGILGYMWLAAFWFTYYTPERVKNETRARIIPPRILFKKPFVRWFIVLNFMVDPIWYFITFWIARSLQRFITGSDQDWLVCNVPFYYRDLGNILGGYLHSSLSKEVFRCRKPENCHRYLWLIY